MTTVQSPQSAAGTGANLSSRVIPVERWRLMAFLLVFVLIPTGQIRMATRRIEIADVQKLVGVSDPQISPDGKSIVVLVSRVNWKEDRQDSELVLVDIATRSQRVLTFDRKGLGSPRWSPNGDRLAFVAAVGPEKEAHEQIFILPMNGGEPRKMTDAPEGVEQFAWSPDGKEITYVTPDEPANKEDIKNHNDAFEVGNIDFLATSAPTPSHIWLIAADGGKARRLTSGSWSLAKTLPPSPPSSPLSWSPDAKFLAFAKQATPFLGDANQSVVELLEIATGKTQKLTPHTDLEGLGVYSPDGNHIAYLYSRDGNINNENEIYVTAPGGGEGVDLTRSIDRNLVRAIWMPDSKSLLVGGHSGTRVSMWIQPLDGPVKSINLGEVNPSWLFWIDANVGKNGAIAFTGSSPHHPTELYYLTSADSKPTRLTDFNHEVASLDLGDEEAFEWQGPDGFKEDAVLVFPPGFQRDKKYPLILHIHGGPQAASVLNFSFFDQLIASHGYVVFEPNYRGSDNLGNAYQRAIEKDAGDGPGRDVMAGLAELEKQGFIDSSRIGVSGWSYGGYMTSWLIGHYHNWKVAVSGAAVNDVVDEYNLSDFNVIDGLAFGGSPWVGDNMKLYREQSPITYAARITTPTLILCDTGDFRVPITQSYKMYHALKDNGIPVKFYAYPVPGHFPGDPVRQSDVFKRWLDWLDQYLK
jgi:dipeptidyl aminopeptidase/acylaminoacyl peptidase